jgi:nitroimidazol reductase NimA-like FMN-containing flavoprotein (pyridoxamine 5'-phosphate oxidase superfamily)
MLGSLNRNQCEMVLHTCLIGRVGCLEKDRIYIVPVSYAFDKGYIYVCSKEGRKIDNMRQHVDVCFQTDEVDDLKNWRSVVAWGKFEELSKPQELEHATKILSDRFAMYLTGETLNPVFLMDDGLPKKERRPIFYRLKIIEMTGRYEKHD